MPSLVDVLFRPSEPFPHLAFFIDGTGAADCFRFDSIEITSQSQILGVVFGTALDLRHTMSFDSGDSRFLLSLRFFNSPFYSMLMPNLLFESFVSPHVQRLLLQ